MKCPDCKGKGQIPTRYSPEGYGIECIDCISCGGTGQYRDPYLVPWQVCEFFHNDYPKKRTGYFTFYRNGKPCFVDLLEDVGRVKNEFGEQFFDYFEVDWYRPHGTEWDFAKTREAFDWDAVCSTIDKDGLIKLWSSQKIFCKPDTGVWCAERLNDDNHILTRYIVCGICPDKSRYENGAWMDSQRERPFWAEVKG